MMRSARGCKGTGERLITRVFEGLIHFNKVEKGGHFAAWEQPKLSSEEVRAGFRSLRPGVAKQDVSFAKAS